MSEPAPHSPQGNGFSADNFSANNFSANNFLATACAQARERVASARRQRPLEALREQAQPGRPGRLAAALLGDGVAVVAEVKRSSPRGHVAIVPDVGELAGSYERGGAAAVSVLTEPRYFSGSLDDLRAAAAAVDVPVLRKDFVVEAYQVWEAAAAGAAAVLLIVAALEQDTLVALLAEAGKAGLDALVETAAEHEVARAVGAHGSAGVGTPLVVGVNARDMTTLEVDPGRFVALRPAVPREAVAVAESGVRGPDDVAALAAAGADAVLVGGAVASASDPQAAVAALVAAGRRAGATPARDTS